MGLVIVYHTFFLTAGVRQGCARWSFNTRPKDMLEVREAGYV